MTRPQHMTATDYTPADLDEIRTLMHAAVSEWERLLKEHAPHGQWQPASSDVLQQLTEADSLLAAVSRTVLATRTEIRSIDARARQHFLAHIPKQPVA
ncbi:hypothetical protein ACIBBE_42795 [Streptomyces sp. NPDC051644]|uniref:hypothetical protein n=1 Tax=Streptomyces sp. NPDC051644 TaxID=3365666 RepID=UPI0037AAEAD3